MNGLLEILTNKHWMMDPKALHGIRAVMESNLQAHMSAGTFSKRQSFAATYRPSETSDWLRGESGVEYSPYRASSMNEPFVDVIMIAGPVTRNGGACSYGSADHRDFIMAAADNPNCHGHVIFLDTPGGSAWAVNDYMQAIDYAKSKGQPVYAFIDGCCASAGMYIAAMCDKRFYMHPKDEVGCIGTMAAFYTQKDGGSNQFTDETYHEIYDPESFDKNKWYRDIANEGDTTELVEELKKLGADFRAYVSERCPEVKDEHLHGKVFEAEAVKGILVDEQSTLGEVIALCFEQGAANIPDADEPDGDAAEDRYHNIATACGVPALAIDTEGAFLSTDMLDSLSASLDSMSETVAHIADNHSAEIDRLNEQHAAALAEAEAKQAETLANVTAERDTLSVELAETKQQLADRDSTIEAMTAQAAETHDESPSCNGNGAEVAKPDLVPAYDSSLSPAENKRILNEWKRKHNL